MYGMMSFAAAPTYTSLLQKERKNLSFKTSLNSGANAHDSDNNSLKTSVTNSTLTGFDLESTNNSFDEFVTKVNLETRNIHNNYSLTKMDTRQSQDGPATQYRVSLSLTKPEIELIRYTWNKMLLDDEDTTPRPPSRSTSPGIPGGYPGDETLTRDTQSSNSSTAKMIKAQSSAIATSLFCRQFYANLLSHEPALEKMFPSIKHQAVSFAAVLSLAVMQLENLSSLEDYLFKLGKRHTRILNIEPVHYELMGEALIQTFHERFGFKFNQELEILWIKVYLYLANSILQFGIDPVMQYNETPNPNSLAAPSFTPSRRNSMVDEIASTFDDTKSMSTQTTSLSTHITGMFKSHKNNGHDSKPVSPVDPLPYNSMIPSISRHGSQPQIRAAPPPPPQIKKMPKKRKRDCVIM
ncbi:uncharacterized protein SPAPADRAFT_58104 [Spathaspora passalidarum NRRL Y-27907]|uniref:Globin domain-containing protein n=1 Tax=Spathaspora passalidarum (strain NRRL Y-27907 / 11-Y1) TaxID=619300 RepID=G3AFI8_SPAPN|nr:uncharacterized protein SPAPADRAFT_58104 [Spathaspora passalidarum NRRL Y-27907]EGW34977.1 hypothetical protein SPAPADRAFT_58104 [Spathaspora passalidarum NRRL Y-27907]